MITLKFDDGEITVRKVILERCNYFNTMFQLNPDDSVVKMYDYNKSLADFKHILNFLVTNNPIIPFKLHHEVDFYGVSYPKYNLESNYTATFLANGTKFGHNSLPLMQKSNFLKSRLENLYVGTLIHIELTPEIFQHLLNRIQDDKYVIPGKYEEIYSKGFPVLNIDDNENLVPILVCGTYKYIKVRNAILCPSWKKQLLTKGCVESVFHNNKVFEKVNSFLITGTGLYDIHTNDRKRLGL